MNMTIELIKNNYNKLISMINEDVNTIQSTNDMKLKESTVSQLEEIINVINEDYRKITHDNYYTEEDDDYYCRLDSFEELEKPFKEVLKVLKG